jgi:hypothetical protein
MEALVRESIGWVERQVRIFRDGKSVLQKQTMSNSRYCVVGNNDVWMIQFQDTENDQYTSSNKVASLAIAAAQKLGMRGERAHVCVLDDDGGFRCKWSYSSHGPQDRCKRYRGKL